MKTLDKESFSRIAKFYEIEGVILETDQKMYASFGRERAFHSTTVSEILQTMYENDLFDMLPEFSNVGAFPCSDTSYIVFSRTIIQRVRRLKTYLRNNMGQQLQRVSDIALIN